MYDVSDIVGAIMFINSTKMPRLIILDRFGDLYHVGDIFKLRINGVCIHNSIGSRNVFVCDIVPGMGDISYNTILSRIEDIYGMSIEEFSLGKLEYM